MKILKLTLENFQGLKHFELETQGKNVRIYGDNGTGKSTVFNAFTWLMYGKSSTDEKNYTPKTIDSHHLNHVVELAVELDDGAQVIYRKDYHEVYKTKKGNPNPIFDGHTSDYTIDGVPVKESEFNLRLKDLYKSEELAKILTSYSYFLESVKPKERRQKLLEICGDVSFETVISLNSELLELPEILKKPGATDSCYTVEEFQAIAVKGKKMIDKQLKEIPGRIDEVEKAMPATGPAKRSDCEKSLEELTAKKVKLNAEKEASGTVAIVEQQKVLAEAKTAYSKAEAAYHEAFFNQGASVRQEITKLQEQADALETEINKLIRKKRERSENVTAMQECRDRLMSKWKEESAKQWTGSSVCPTCGQPLPEEAIDKAKSEFNLAKSKALEDIKKRGMVVSKDTIAAEKAMVEELASQIESRKKELLDKNALISERKSTFKQPEPFAETADGQQLAKRVTELEKELANQEKVRQNAMSSLDEQLAEIESSIRKLNETLANFAQIEKLKARKKELEAEEKALATNYEAFSKGLYLCDLYFKTKAEALSEKVNDHFETIKFRLFIEQQNGGVADDCEALIPCKEGLIPFKSANTAARINAGLEIIDSLSQFYGVTLPVFIDGSESCTEIRTTKAQQIRLYVSEDDKELRAEYE